MIDRQYLPVSLERLLDDTLLRNGRVTDGSCDEMEDLISYPYLMDLLMRAYEEGQANGWPE